jgi:heme/copper-type cytochrome/quinol oxidase subunit 3
MDPRSGDVIHYPSTRAHGEGTGFIGMVIFLGSWAMMFAALFFVYAAVRMRSEAWPPLDQPSLPIGLPAVNTAVLAASSVTFELALRAVRRGELQRLERLLGVTLGLGIAFVLLQVDLWSAMFTAGVAPASGPYASVFYGFTGLHALHVLVGLVALVWLTFRARRRAYSTPRHQAVRLWSMYWHFVGIVWVAMFVGIFLV